MINFYKLNYNENLEVKIYTTAECTNTFHNIISKKEQNKFSRLLAFIIHKTKKKLLSIVNFSKF